MIVIKQIDDFGSGIEGHFKDVYSLIDTQTFAHLMAINWTILDVKRVMLIRLAKHDFSPNVLGIMKFVHE